MWRGVPFARPRRPIIGVVGLCWLLRGSFPAPPSPPVRYPHLKSRTCGANRQQHVHATRRPAVTLGAPPPVPGLDTHPNVQQKLIEVDTSVAVRVEDLDQELDLLRRIGGHIGGTGLPPALEPRARAPGPFYSAPPPQLLRTGSGNGHRRPTGLRTPPGVGPTRRVHYSHGSVRSPRGRLRRTSAASGPLRCVFRSSLGRSSSAAAAPAAGVPAGLTRTKPPRPGRRAVTSTVCTRGLCAAGPGLRPYSNARFLWQSPTMSCAGLFVCRGSTDPLSHQKSNPRRVLPSACGAAPAQHGQHTWSDSGKSYILVTAESTRGDL